jgi:hypothetical protein
VAAEPVSPELEYELELEPELALELVSAEPDELDAAAGAEAAVRV